MSTQNSTTKQECPHHFTNADVQNLIRVMQGAAQLGIFNIREYQEIGRLFDSLDKFSQHANDPKKDACPLGFSQADLTTFCNIIDNSAKRGLFVGNDLETVGSLYVRLRKYKSGACPALEKK